MALHSMHPLNAQVVGILSLSASLLHVPDSVMGLTLMAWGNSLQDLAGNTRCVRAYRPPSLS